MKTDYKYICFRFMDRLIKTEVWACLNEHSGCQIGTIKWYGRWRQYCFFPFGNTVFSSGCLNDINDFIRQLMEARKK